MDTAPQFFRRGPGLLARLVFFALLSLLLMAADVHLKYLLVLRQAVAVVIYPVQKLANAPAAIYDRMSEFFVTQSRLTQENAQHKQQHLIDSGQIQQLQALAAEHAQLRKLLEIRQRVENKAVVAEILYVPRDPFSRKAMLDKGGQSGIQTGQVVIDDAGVVGQITRVYPWLSEITLLTDKDHSVPVQVVRSGLRSVVSGAGEGGVLELRYLAVNADIQNGDLLVTSGIDGIYPPGLPVALVSNIERNTAYAFARITCTPVAGVDRNRQVLILSPLPPAPEKPVEPAEIKPKGKVSKRGKSGAR